MTLDITQFMEASETEETQAFERELDREFEGVKDRYYLYVIGPVTYIENENLQAFRKAEERLKAAGHHVDIPHRYVGPFPTWEDAMCASIRRMMTMWYKAMKGRYGFGLAMLDGWEQSRGARIEHDLAEALDIPCKPWREWL